MQEDPGIAATAKLGSHKYIKNWAFLHSSLANIRMQISRAAILNVLPVLSGVFEGVKGASSAIISLAILPTSVFMPVSVTSPVPLPYA